MAPRKDEDMRTTALLLIALTLMTGCKRNMDEVPDARPSAYYWQTRFELNERERKYMEQERIGKLYVRLFDIVATGQGPMPNATISFEEPLPEGVTVVPTVFVDYTLFREAVDVEKLAQQTVRRIAQMGETHGFRYDELQFDCDWTAKTQERYYDFLRAVARADTGLTLSATIRLHQLSMTPPPVRYGALMLYNTGDFRKAWEGRNPILDAEDVVPYMNYLAGYALPLCACYPNFEWKLLFRGEEFVGLLYDEDVSDTTMYMPVDEGTYQAIGMKNIAVAKGRPFLHVAPGDRVRVWRSEAEQIAKVRAMVESRRPHINDQTIVYHLGGEGM